MEDVSGVFEGFGGFGGFVLLGFLDGISMHAFVL